MLWIVLNNDNVDCVFEEDLVANYFMNEVADK